MTAMTVAERMNAKQFLKLPEHPAAQRMELIEGEVVVTEPGALHNYVQFDLAFALGGWSRSEPGLGRVVLPLDVGIDYRNVYGPDVAWYAEGRVPAREATRPFGMPDLAVEVRSPSTWRYDIGSKKSGYESNGLPELWLVDTEAHVVLVFRRSTPEVPTFDVALELYRDQQLTSPLLLGFALALAEVVPER